MGGFLPVLSRSCYFYGNRISINSSINTAVEKEKILGLYSFKGPLQVYFVTEFILGVLILEGINFAFLHGWESEIWP